MGRRSDGTSTAGGECEPSYGETALGRGRRRARRVRGTASSPGARNRGRLGARRSRAASIGPEEQRPEAEENERRRRLRDPRPDSFGGKGEDDEAEPTVVFNRAGAAGVDGGVLGSHGGGDERELDLGLGFRGHAWGTVRGRVREQVRPWGST